MSFGGAAVRLDRVERRLAFGVWPLAALAAWASLVVAWETLRPVEVEATLCVFRTVTGTPCPTCGGTRAAMAAADGRWVDAVAHNPLLVAAAVLAVAWLVLRVGFGRRVRVDVGNRGRWGRIASWSLLGAALAANWIWVIARETIGTS